MRRAVLLRSVARVLGEGVTVYEAAYMWTRHRHMLLYASAVFLAFVLFAPVAGIDEWPTRLVIGLGGTAVAVTATTEYRVVAQTSDGLVLFRASRIRQVATQVKQRLEPGATLQPVGGTILAADWQVGDNRYTVSRSSEQAMNRMAAAL